MTTCHLTLLVQDILSECINQVSLDFRAIRTAAGGGADASYDDFMLSLDEKQSFVVEFQSAVAELCAIRPAAIRLCSLTEDRFAVEITIYRPLPSQVVERMLKDYMKARLLGWWYWQRNPGLSQLQGSAVAEFKERLLSALSPSCTTRRLRHF